MVQVIDLGNDTFEVIINSRTHTLTGPALSEFLDNIPTDIQVEYLSVSDLCCC